MKARKGKETARKERKEREARKREEGQKGDDKEGVMKGEKGAGREQGREADNSKKRG